MWFGVIATLKNQRTGTRKSNWNEDNEVPDNQIGMNEETQYSTKSRVEL